MSIPTTQRAWHVVRRGTPAQALELLQNIPVPSELKEGEVLLRVDAAALNPVGYKLMKLLPNFLARRPYAAENDLAGTVVASKSSLWQAGDRVFGFIEVPLQRKIQQGALSQYTRLPGNYLTRRPDNITAVDAAGITLAAQTAYQALVDFGGLEEGQSVFINGGSSSVGAFAIQIAKAKGAKVWASASGGNEELVRSLGVDHFIDYTKEPLHRVLSANPPDPKFNIFFDAAGLDDASLFTASPKYLAPNGIFVHTSPQFSAPIPSLIKTIWDYWLHPTWLGGTNRTFKLVMLTHKKKDLDELSNLLANGQLKPVVDSIFAFEDALKAYDRLQTHRAKGKVVVKVNPDAE